MSTPARSVWMGNQPALAVARLVLFAATGAFLSGFLMGFACALAITEEREAN